MVDSILKVIITVKLNLRRSDSSQFLEIPVISRGFISPKKWWSDTLLLLCFLSHHESIKELSAIFDLKSSIHTCLGVIGVGAGAEWCLTNALFSCGCCVGGGGTGVCVRRCCISFRSSDEVLERHFCRKMAAVASLEWRCGAGGCGWKSSDRTWCLYIWENITDKYDHKLKNILLVLLHS